MPTLKWIGLRPERKGKINVVKEVEVNATGLVGDRYDIEFGNRNVTLIRQEGLDDAWNKLGKDGKVDPALARRNLVLEGLNPDLKKMKGDLIQIGNAVVLEVTGYCHPCSRMEASFGPGGLKAMAGHGGLTAKVIKMGVVRVGDQVVRSIPGHEKG